MISRLPPQDTVLHFLRDNELLAENEPLLVGVSGGPDSTCLLYILAEIRDTYKLRLHVAHLNHMLRGTESDADAKYVLAQANQLNIPVIMESRDIRSYQSQRKLSLEDAARKVRYAFFARVALSVKANNILLAHTADDQVETVLMNLIRGTGLTGLRGMRAISPLTLPDGTTIQIVRPMLQVRKADIEAYCEAKRIFPRIDSSNHWHNQFRNQVRLQLIPLLRQYNSDIDTTILRAARTIEADVDYLEKEATNLWGSVVKEQPDGGISINRSRFGELHPSMKRHIIRSALQRLLGDLQNIESVHIESLLDILGKPAGKSLSLPRGLMFHGDYGQGIITSKGTISCPFPELNNEYKLSIPGETLIPGWRIKATVHKNHPIETNGRKIKAYFDYNATGNQLAVRQRKRGDRFQPLGMEQEKKLQDFMVDVKIPKDWRDRIPIVYSPQHILWVVGWRIDHRVRVVPTTKQVLELEFEFV